MKPFYKFIFFIVFTSIQYSSYCQDVYYEMPYIFDRGVTKCKRIVVGFKENVISTDRDVEIVDTKLYPIQDNEIKNLLQQLAERYGTPTIIKSVPRLVWGDTLIVNKRTGEISVGPDMSQCFRIDFPVPVPMDSVLNLFRNIVVVKYAEYPVVIKPCVFPDDYYFQSGDQWYLHNTGQTGGTPDADVDAPEAWDITKGSSSIIVAFIDTKGQINIGNHQDLNNKFVDGSSTTNGSEHSVSVAGLIGALTDNGIGIASLGWNTKLYAKHFANNGTEISILEGLIDLASENADIINFSFNTLGGGCQLNRLCPQDYSGIRDAIESARLAGVILVAAADNDPYDQCPEEEGCGGRIPYPSYPAFYPGVIAVTATTHLDQFYDGWNFGNWVDVSAPGLNIYTTHFPPNLYYNFGGTSASAPIVSALAALILSINNFSATEVEEIIKEGADKVGQYPYVNGWNKYMGYGRINAFKSVTLAAAYVNKSANYDATAHNNNHILERGFFSKLHEVFQSGGEIFYRRSGNNGDSWEITKRITTGNSSNNHPSIAAANSGSNDVLCLVWQKKIDSRHYDIMYSISSNMGTSWTIPAIVPGCSNVWISYWQSGDYYGPGPTPVVAGFSGYGGPAGAFLLVYAAENGLHYRYSNSWYNGWIIPGNDVIPGSEGSLSKNWYPSLATYNSQDTYSGYSRVNLTYDNRYNNVYSQIFNYLNGTASWTNRVQVSSTGDNNRLSSIAVDYAGDRLAVWSGFNGTNFVTRFRKGYANGTWSSWYKEWSVSGTNSLCPAVTYYNKPLPYPYGIDIVWYTEPPSKAIIQKRYFGTSDLWWSTVLLANSGLFANLTHERQNTTLPKQIYTDQSTPPLYPIFHNSDYLPKGDLLVDSEIHRAAEIADTSNNSYLRIELSEPIVTFTNGEEIKIPFKDYNYLDTLELTTENIFDYLQTELMNIPNNAQSVTFKVEIHASQPDTLSDGTLNTNPHTPFRTINFGLLARDSSRVLINNIVNHLLNNLSGIHHYSREFTINASALRRKNVTMIPNINISGIFNQNNLYFSLVNVSIEGEDVGKDSPETNENIIPTVFSLEQNYPNPFNPITKIKYSIVKAGLVILKIYDVVGREVVVLVDEEKPVGTYEAEFNASNLSSGIYFYSISAGSFHQTKKMILLK